MAFRTNAAPYQRSSKSTTQIMLELCIALSIIWICAVVTSFIKLGTKLGIRSILIMVIALVTTAICDVLTVLIKHKKGGKTSLKDEIIDALKYNYSYVTAIIFALTLPAWTSYYVVIVGSVFATVVVKNFFGGFGKNIFNPAAMARIFVMICFASGLSPTKSITTGIDATSGATVTTLVKSASWITDSYPLGLSTSDILFGNYFGAMGETFTVIILVLGILLAIRKDINWRTPVFYLGTVTLVSLVIALTCGLDPFKYLVLSLGLGGVVFGAVFMLTDPVTGPTSSFGKALVGVLAGLLTVLIRVKGNYIEGVVFSIAICNLISPAIDYLTVGKTSNKLVVKYATVFGLLAVSIALNAGIAVSVKNNQKQDPIPQPTPLEDAGFTLKDGHTYKESTNTNAKYIITKNGSDVAYVYEVKGTEINVLEAEDSFTMKGFVAFNLKDGSIYGFGNLRGGTDNQFAGALQNYANTLVDKQVNALDIYATMGASAYSLPELKEVLYSSYSLFLEDTLTLQEGHSAKVSKSGKSDYTIYDSANNIVAYAYRVEASEADAYGDKFTMSAIVIINKDDNKIYSISSIQNAGSERDYSESLINYASTLNGKGQSDLTLDASMGASDFSLPSLVELINKAYTLHTQQGGKN